MGYRHVTAGVRGLRATGAVALLIAALAMCATSSAGACSGRPQLTCAEKQAIAGEYLTWGASYGLDLELSEIRLPARLRDASMLSFWRAETAAAAARSMLDVELDLALSDPNFETYAAVPRLHPPTIHPDRVVSRATARLLTRILAAEWEEVGSLRAMLLSLDRAANASSDRARADWARAQLAAGAHFAAQAARALNQVIGLQPRVARALRLTRLRYGVGPVDLRVAKRVVRAHGIDLRVQALMSSLGMNADEVTYCRKLFLQASSGASFTLSVLLSNASTLTSERALHTALRGFAGRIPPAPTPTH